MRKYPETAAACREHAQHKAKTEQIQWKIGAALIKEVGWPPPLGKNDNSFAELSPVALELEEIDGLAYPVEELSRYRAVTAAFSAKDRAMRDAEPIPQINQELSFDLHKEAPVMEPSS